MEEESSLTSNLYMASVVASTDLCTEESDKGHGSFTETYIDNECKLNYHSLACILLDTRNTEIFIGNVLQGDEKI